MRLYTEHSFVLNNFAGIFHQGTITDNCGKIPWDFCRKIFIIKSLVNMSFKLQCLKRTPSQSYFFLF